MSPLLFPRGTEKMTESIVSGGQSWRGVLVLLLPQWLWECIGTLAITVQQSSAINASFCSPRQKRGDSFSIHICSVQRYDKRDASQRREQKVQLMMQSENYWWNRRQMIKKKNSSRTCTQNWSGLSRQNEKKHVYHPHHNPSCRWFRISVHL